jgi:cytoskeletal protein CcmA (bactofilin family)
MFQKPSPDIALTHNDPMFGVADDIETVVGPSVHVEGDFVSDGNILVKGIVSGMVQTSKRLTVEPGAKIYANVKAGTAIISGEIKGNVKVTDRLEVTGTARIAGDVECQTLVVEAGALLSGRVSMKGVDIELPKSSRKPMVRKSSRLDENDSTQSDEDNETLS